MSLPLPAAFTERMQQQLGEAFPDFINALNAASPVSIRLNPLKPATLDFPAEGEVPWNSDGRYLPERPVFTLDPLFHAGAYYVQEASSMFLKETLRQLADFNRPLKVLDLCAAPGGKTTLLAGMLPDNSLLVANEVIKKRVGILRENVERWGYPNVIVTNHDPEEFVELEGFFDIVLVDAPCSGEGLFRKDPAACDEWSPQNAALCSARQQRILRAAAMLVAPDGLLLYSTCTYNVAENDDNVKWLAANTDLQPVTLPEPIAADITPTAYGYQFYPHKTKGEGFYLAAMRQSYGEDNAIRSKIKLPRLSKKQREVINNYVQSADNYEFFIKPDGRIVAVANDLTEDYGVIFRALSKRSSGIETGEFKGDDFIPSHALALSLLANQQLPRVELPKPEALRYLKREDTDWPELPAAGWFLVTYQNLPLGWAKMAGNRVNNYLPKDYRIRMDIL